ncbi:hypothetical protein ASD89_19645 [Caulobacter sp. Root656]|nr:hypothetical protein ASD89_19645 [Caulobacter sp. Root656]
MPTTFHASRRLIALASGTAALASWVIVLLQGLPRWTAGPLCGASDDLLSLAGHCPACWPAVAFSVMFLATMRGRRTLSPCVRGR